MLLNVHVLNRGSLLRSASAASSDGASTRSRANNPLPSADAAKYILRDPHAQDPARRFKGLVRYAYTEPSQHSRSTDMERHGRTVGSADLSHLAGKAIKLRILLEKARFYSFWFN